MDLETTRPMKVQYISDLHLECSMFYVEKSGDVLVLAGDIFNAHSVLDFEAFLERTMGLGFKAVLFVFGNHEGYGWSASEAKALLRTMEDKYDRFWFLDRAGVVIDDQRFLGASLWSAPTTPANIHARLYINDYRAIRGWTIDDHVREHWKDRDYLMTAVRKDDVVITHFPPTSNGMDANRFGGDVLNSWFVNSMDDVLLNTKPQLWISGHTHHVWDEMVGYTRDVGNCRGYTHKDVYGTLIGEVKTFDPTRAIKIETTHGSSIGATP